MDALVLALSLLLAGVFAVAGVAKLRDAEGSRQALDDFGVPARLSRPAARLLPLVEIAVAIALMLPATARWAALAAAALLAAFMGAIANAMRQGRAPDCHCFGQLHSEPAGRSTLVRNSVLFAMAGIVAAFGPGPAVHSWIADRSALELLALGGLLVGAALAIRPARHHIRRRQERRAHAAHLAQAEAALAPSGLPVGAPAPDFSLPSVGGRERTLEALCAAGRPVVLVFVQPTCGPCKLLLPRLREWRSTLREALTIAVLSEGGVEANAALAEAHGIEDLLLQPRGEVYEAYEVQGGTPAAVVVDRARKIGSVAVAGDAAIEELVRLTLRRSQPFAEPLAS